MLGAARRGAHCRHPFQGQQPHLAVQPAGIAGQAAVGPQHAVAGHHHAEGVAAHGRAHGAHGAGLADERGQRAIARGLAPGNLQQRPPHRLLERRAVGEVQRQVEVAAAPGEVFLHLRTGSDAHDLEPQVAELGNVADTLGMMGLGVARDVVMQQRDTLRDVVAGSRPADEGTLLDVAGALLYVDASLDDQVARLGSAGDAAPDPSTA